jgi:CPA2 family monovalent cation:H+ antiporter-2
MLVVAIDGKEQITEMVKYVVANFPQVHVVARAVDRDHVYDLYAAGCRDIIRETYDSSVRMGRSAFEALGASRAQAEAMAGAFEAMDRKGMIAVAEHYDPDVPVGENAAYIARVLELTGEWEAELSAEMDDIRGRGVTAE